MRPLGVRWTTGCLWYGQVTADSRMAKQVLQQARSVMREGGMNQEMRTFGFKTSKRIWLLQNKSEVTVGTPGRNNEMMIIQCNSVAYLFVNVLAEQSICQIQSLHRCIRWRTMTRTTKLGKCCISTPVPVPHITVQTYLRTYSMATVRRHTKRTRN
jgi:hypothetical protein